MVATQPDARTAPSMVSVRQCPPGVASRTRPALTTSVAARPVRRHAASVEENQPLWIDPLDLFPPEAPPDLAFDCVLPDGVERLFFSRKPMAPSTSHNRDRLL